MKKNVRQIKKPSARANAKRRISAYSVGLFTVTLITAAGVPSIAHGEPLLPVGPYSEARLQNGAPQPRAVTPVHKVAAPAQARGVTDEVKDWVQNKWSALKTAWSGDTAPAKTQLAPQPARQTASVPSKANSSATNTVSHSPAAIEPIKMNPAQANLPVVAPTATTAPTLDLPGVQRGSSGLLTYDLSAGPSIPRIRIEREEKVSNARYAIDSRLQKIMDDKIISPFASPELLSETDRTRLSSFTQGSPTSAQSTPDVIFPLKGKVSREAFEKLVLNLGPEVQVKLQKYVPLSAEETRFLSGLLLFEQGDKCAAAVGLFHKLSRSPGWEPEANFYLAMCSKKLGLETDFVERARRIIESKDQYYAKKIMNEIDTNTPLEFTDRLGLALAKMPTSFLTSLKPEVAGSAAFMIASHGASSADYKLALSWAKKVPNAHPKFLQARFIEALAEYEVGSKSQALKIQEELIETEKTGKAKGEFQALVALNVARMYFQEKQFKPAHEAFNKVYKDHALWLQSLTEMGWSQLMSGDYEGAIGNMYSIQSPFFGAVYKPESYVIRAIGYLNLCQYGDAYKTLSMLEHEYRPYAAKMTSYLATPQSRYQTVKNLLQVAKGAKEAPKDVDGLPASVVREMARHRDFTNLQKALNREIDERPLYGKIENEVDRSLRSAQKTATNSRRRVDQLNKNISSIAKRHDLEQNRNAWTADLSRELEILNEAFFQVDLYTEAKASLIDYKRDVIGGADARLASMRGQLEKILGDRLKKMNTELALVLENNELLRYEVFAGSGENIRYQVAGGEKGNRVPASVIPKSKSLQWDFDGEYWEDEIGHYRSSLKNNCPETHGQQANLDTNLNERSGQ